MAKEKFTIKELESMSYTDIANYVLEQAGKKMTTKDLFLKVIELRGDDPAKIFESRIGDFFGLISADKRFIMLDKGFWDLRVNHKHQVVKIEEDDDDDEIVIDEEELEDKDDESNFDDVDEVDDADDEDDDLKDLVIIDDSEDEANQDL
ncbi:MAG TPA: DNA-directed RNA polymerase subunit delta [Bacilli bacterium]|jgi:DNA-directed RNA polymerase subunit delta|nr:DNA-directed RNA polymerase subunit delta [Bacilli bacterium]HPZ23260.1 DNA-directed RNA polymerase subunit delta [Bacilli bacterium]HQC83277.1 DNA-directed RNA polymerase subunit delta [Bacilli bacterium]